MRLIALLGPTACGKSDLALDLASKYDLEILNCDSRQVYREMEIGTGKPSLSVRKKVPHHLFDLACPTEQI
ncbi:tRNA (adenosine(37)-N6)-dimethylallyltransferase MiaA, partial [bacterium]|nr:tRNA (adenosine(37)-N6)-dimethylallyltransferase MiaA [bacterium]